MAGRPASAAVYNVGAGDVAGLITAINAANATAQADTIVLAAGTYTLVAADHVGDDGANGLPAITSEIGIVGADAATTVIERQSAAPAFRLLSVGGGGRLLVQDLTLRRGVATTGSPLESSGGGIHNRGTIELLRVVLTDHTAVYGGAVQSRGTAVFRQCTVANNSALQGGGLHSNILGHLFVYDSTVRQNTAAQGGGIEFSGASLTLGNSTVDQNVATGIPSVDINGGGGVRAEHGSVIIFGSTFSANTTGTPDADGGGLFSGQATVIVNSTFSGNAAAGDGGGVYSGRSARTNVSHCTFADNSARRGGGFFSRIGDLNVANTVVAGNSAAVSGPDCQGDIGSYGGNVIGDPMDCRRAMWGGPDLEAVDPLLGPLGGAGGPTAAHALLAGSPARDAAELTYCPGVDQRGSARPVDGDGSGAAACDSGAVEEDGGVLRLTGDHFICHRTRVTPGTPAVAPLTVSLADAFVAATFDVPHGYGICVPAAAEGGAVADADTRLKVYRAHLTADSPPFVGREALQVTNSLGQFSVDTLRPGRLMVPSALDADGPLPAPNSADHDVDHFLCYRARATSGTFPWFRRRLVHVAAATEFDAIRRFRLGRIKSLCVAADKNGEGMKNPAARLLCFRARALRHQERHRKRSGLWGTDQFGTERLDTGRSVDLCVPSTEVP